MLPLLSVLPDSPLGSPSVTPGSSSSLGGGGGGPLPPGHAYSSSPLSLFRLQEQFRQHMVATSGLVHYPAFDMTGGHHHPSSPPHGLPYLGMNNISMPAPAPLGPLPCQSAYYQSLSHHAAQQVWGAPLLQASAAAAAAAAAAATAGGGGGVGAGVGGGGGGGGMSSHNSKTTTWLDPRLAKKAKPPEKCDDGGERVAAHQPLVGV